MELIVMRHGHAEALARRDEDRKLSSHGRENVGFVVRALASMGMRPNVILASPLLRAQQTAAIASDVLESEVATKPSIETEPLLVPEGRVDDFVATLAGRDRDSCVLIASHMPFVADLIGRMTCGGSNSSLPLSTACAVWIELSHPQSRDGHLVAAVSPPAARMMLGIDRHSAEGHGSE